GSFVCDQFIRKDYSTFKSYEEVVKSLKKCSNQPLVGISAGMIWNFGNIMQKGDIIVANSGIKGILGIGLIESDYINPIKSKKLNLDEDEEFFHFRKVKWLIKDEIEFNSQIFDRKTITPIYSDKWQKIKEAYVKKDSEYEDIFRKIENYKSYTKIKTKNDEIDISEEYHSFNEYLNHENFIYTPEMIENFLLSLKVKPFVILTGNSGTGKTKIAQLFAEYLQNKNKGEFLIIPVGANWTENRHLMGFYNVITRDYQSTPALDLIIKARNDISNPYFLILDEMNLSHVERYFSDFLSAIESGKEISLYSTENAQKIKNKNIPEKIKIPHNLFVVGTVNVDETTYMFSPKVLDRANTIEFKTYPARDYIMSEIEHKVPEGNIDYLENPLSNLKIRNYKINKLKDQLTHVKINDNNNLWEVLALEIHSFQEALSEAGFDFGFRVIDEVMRFMYATWLYEDSPDEWKNWTRYFDAQIMQKMLPKIHGSQQELSQVLENLFELCYSGESINKIWYSANLEEYEIKYPSSAKKLQKMGKKLQEKRFVSFTD
ncbi:MAG: AAA family ATPase, partial [Methanobacteriaceae archaeon]|nr:AAA family ATPase [Methanobacteriaceae archaeon]